jgi:hypothetical protein
MPEQHHPEEIAHDVADIRADVAYERAQLDASIKHDYSTSETGVVPLDKRRPMWHFMGLWTTFVAGFSYMFLGFEIRDGGRQSGSRCSATGSTSPTRCSARTSAPGRARRTAC